VRNVCERSIGEHSGKREQEDNAEITATVVYTRVRSLISDEIVAVKCPSFVREVIIAWGCGQRHTAYPQSLTTLSVLVP